MNKAIVYTRVSTEQQADEGTSLETQELSCLRRAAELKAEVAGVLSDEGLSGAYYAARPGLQAALARIEKGEANLLIVYSVSRLSRDMEHQQAIKKRLAVAGAALIVCDTPLEDTPEGDLMFGITGAFAQYERNVIRKRTMSGRRKRAEDGQQPSRAVSPFGYHVVTKPDVFAGRYTPETLGTYQLAPEQAPVAAEIFRRYAASGSLRSVCRFLSERNVPTPQGGATWLPSTIKIILQNPVYKGCPVWGRKQSRTDETRMETARAARYNVAAPAKDIVLLSAPAIVAADLWAQCQERMATNQKTQSGNPERRFLLSGLLRCPHCDLSLSGEHNKGSRYYNCSRSRTYRTVGGPTCPRKKLRAEEPETILLRDLQKLAKQPERFADALRAFQKIQTQDQSGAGDALPRLQAELRELEKRENATANAQIDALTQGRPTAVYDRLLASIGKDRAGIEARIAALAPVPALCAPRQPQTEGERIAAVLRDVETVLSAPDELVTVAEKRHALSLIVRAIRLIEGGYSVELAEPLASSEARGWELLCTFLFGSRLGRRKIIARRRRDAGHD